MQRAPKSGRNTAQDEANWDAEGVVSYREELFQRILNLSAAWKAEKEQEKKEKEKGKESKKDDDEGEVVPDSEAPESEDEIIVGEVNLTSAKNPPPKAAPKSKQGKKGGSSRAGKANRLRWPGGLLGELFHAYRLDIFLLFKCLLLQNFVIIPALYSYAFFSLQDPILTAVYHFRVATYFMIVDIPTLVNRTKL